VRNIEPAISVNNLTKHYGDLTALNSISFDVPLGSVFARAVYREKEQPRQRRMDG
jgi:ABC-type phosphonate transport system ATPase subunit